MVPVFCTWRFCEDGSAEVCAWHVFPRRFYYWLIKAIAQDGWDEEIRYSIQRAVTGQDVDGVPGWQGRASQLTALAILRRLARLLVAFLVEPRAAAAGRLDLPPPPILTDGGQTAAFIPLC